ncbi:group I truncated hemoglobin [Glaciecola sp.]|jgi:hemoglobin|uniref:group I truncated hemoglobin n=1 Tax=Glaciecola sp. MF2-115 TaxID=3384827 RepID=UPI0039897786|mmetsp:Transcript_229/g.480  ORF Transcript_229/g.480 Transcript_229/m.480 type:complete len:149 (-) Transcript_229:195-641(-)
MLTNQIKLTTKFIAIAILSIGFLSACKSTSSSTLYQDLGGEAKIEEIVDNFINEIAFDESTYAFFKDSNMQRFKEKLSQQLCVMAEGPCTYTGDSMEQVHSGMDITEADFNHGVDLFISAMDKANIPHNLQNRLLKEMAKTRGEIIYR